MAETKNTEKQNIEIQKEEEKEKLEKYLQAAEKLYTTAIKDGWNADGAPGIVYTTDWNGKPVVHA